MQKNLLPLRENFATPRGNKKSYKIATIPHPFCRRFEGRETPSRRCFAAVSFVSIIHPFRVNLSLAHGVNGEVRIKQG